MPWYAVCFLRKVNLCDVCFSLLFLVSKTNLSVHEDKNRVPYVKVRPNHLSHVKDLVKPVGLGH